MTSKSTLHGRCQRGVEAFPICPTSPAFPRGRTASGDRLLPRPSLHRLLGEYHNPPAPAPARDLGAQVTVYPPLHQGVGAPPPATSVYLCREHSEPASFGVSRRGTNRPGPSPAAVSDSLRSHSQCSSVEYQRRLRGDWLSIDTRLSGRKKALWESRVA